MTSNPSSKKTLNLQQNPNVSLLVHDWVSSRPPQTVNGAAGAREQSPGGRGGGRASSLANILMQMNSAAMSSISATINGQAVVLEDGSEEEKWCKEQHLANNTFEQAESSAAVTAATTAGRQHSAAAATATPQLFGTSPDQTRMQGDGGRCSYIEDEEVRVVVVRLQNGRISDWKGGVKDWVIADSTGTRGESNPTVNGVIEMA